ncbi:GNAT family N-acetyltransferase [Candidatus Micrarchaeota archaeon]|nr:GNAT family N-acetyltransferase [Candidatus Micrarchaeota archaeon]
MDPLNTNELDYRPPSNVSLETALVSPIHIRRAVTSDSVRLSELTKRFFSYIHISADHVFERIKTGVVYFVLERSDVDGTAELVGFIDFELNDEPNPRHAITEKPPLPAQKTAKILGLCVVPELQGHGWGKKLLAAALSEAKTTGCTQVVMLVEESNATAICIYEKAGFVKRGKLAQKIWGKDVLLYVKPL